MFNEFLRWHWLGSGGSKTFMPFFMRSGYGFLTYDQDNMKNMIFWFYPFDIFQSIFYTFLKQYFHVFKSILTKIHENDKPSENDNFKKIDILVIFFFVEFKIFLDVFPFFRIDFFDVSFFFPWYFSSNFRCNFFKEKSYV